MWFKNISKSLEYTIAYISKIGYTSIFISYKFIYIYISFIFSPTFFKSNMSIFKVVTLLYRVDSILKKKEIFFRNFFVISAFLLGVLIFIYTKATSNSLAGKISINPTIGPISNLFLFDRLRDYLPCSLGNLPINLFLSFC